MKWSSLQEETVTQSQQKGKNTVDSTSFSGIDFLKPLLL
jgi:hypothetical protein